MSAYVGTINTHPYHAGDTFKMTRKVEAMEKALSVNKVALRARNPCARATNCKKPHARKKA